MQGKYGIIDGKPVPAALYEEMLAIRKDTGVTLTSCLRTQEAVNYARGKGFQLSSQLELWNQLGPGKANPPGFSTHELFNDGIAYSVPRGSRLSYWMVGMDWSNRAGVAAVVRSAASRGWICTLTYPTNPYEGQHANFRKKPVLVLYQPLKFGSKGKRLDKLVRDLYYITRPGTDTRYIPSKNHTVFDKSVLKGVRQFQKDHAQKVDGVVGKSTEAQLEVSVRREDRIRKKGLR